MHLLGRVRWIIFGSMGKIRVLSVTLSDGRSPLSEEHTEAQSISVNGAPLVSKVDIIDCRARLL